MTQESSSVGGTSGNSSFVSVMSTSQRVDCSHPLFFSPTDISGVSLI